MQDNITRLLGREVYSNNGIYVGLVEDIQLDIDDQRITGLAIGDVNNELFDQIEKRGVVIPYRWVNSVGDIVIIQDVIENIKAKKEQGQEQV